LEDKHSLLNKGHHLQSVCNSEGYKEAYEYFESLINGMYRSKEVKFDLIQGIEMVFNYFESGEETVKAITEEIDKFKEVD